MKVMASRSSLLAYLLVALTFLTVGAALEDKRREVDARGQIALARAADLHLARALLASVKVEARAAAVYDTKEERFLYGKNAGEALPLASVTKLMLATAIADIIDENDIITIPAEALEREGESLLIAGDAWNAHDLLSFTLIESSNDGAEALAIHAGKLIGGEGSPTQRTVEAMNRKAREIGMTNSIFLDVSGLDIDKSEASARGSAADVVRLMRHATAAMPQITRGTAKSEMEFRTLGGNFYLARNTNKAIGKIEGLIAGKTGFTDLAGGNLAVAIEIEPGHTLIIAVLGSTLEGRFTDVEVLASAARRIILGQ